MLCKNDGILLYTVVLWNSVSCDWAATATAESIFQQTIKLSRPGGIILLHDGGGNRSSTVAALPRIIAELSSRGYRFVTVPELLALSTPPKARMASKKRAPVAAGARSGAASTKPLKRVQG